MRSVLHISPEDAEKVREATPGTRRPKQGDDPCQRARARLRAADEARQAFVSNSPLPETTDAPEWPTEKRKAYQKVVEEHARAAAEVAEHCGQYGPTASYGEGT